MPAWLHHYRWSVVAIVATAAVALGLVALPLMTGASDARSTNVHAQHGAEGPQLSTPSLSGGEPLSPDASTQPPGQNGADPKGSTALDNGPTLGFDQEAPTDQVIEVDTPLPMQLGAPDGAFAAPVLRYPNGVTEWVYVVDTMGPDAGLARVREMLASSGWRIVGEEDLGALPLVKGGERRTQQVMFEGANAIGVAGVSTMPDQPGITIQFQIGPRS